MRNYATRLAELPVAEISVKLLKTGQVRVTGPLAKGALCREMLREAIKVVETYRPEGDIIVPEQKVIVEV